jgi:hypothetical protein
VAHGGTVNPPRNRKGGIGNPPPTGKRARNLSRHIDLRSVARCARLKAPSPTG